MSGSPTPVEFANPENERTFGRLRPLLESGGFPLATDPTRPPTAFLCYLGRGRRRKLLYFYDPAGEFWQSADRMVEQGYLRARWRPGPRGRPVRSPVCSPHASKADAAVVLDARPAAEDPESAYHRLIGGLHGAAGDRVGGIPSPWSCPSWTLCANSAPPCRRLPWATPPPGPGSPRPALVACSAASTTT